jgi:hypothetical protein
MHLYCRRLCVSTKRVCEEHVLLERMRSVFGRGSNTCCVYMWMCLTVVLVSANALAWVLVCASVLASAVLFVQLPLDCGHIRGLQYCAACFSVCAKWCDVCTTGPSKHVDQCGYCTTRAVCSRLPVKCGSGHLNHLGVCSCNGRVLLAAHAALGMYGSGAVLAPLYCDGICRVCSGFHNVAVICGGWLWLQTSH